MIEQRDLISGKLDTFSEKFEKINQFLQSNKASDWDKILEDIRGSTPKSVRITHLLNRGDSTIILEGQALSYEGINLFGDMLVKSSYIESTSLAGTGKSDAGGLVMYSIECKLAEDKGT